MFLSLAPFLYLLAVITSSAHSGNVLVFPHEGSHWVNMRVLVEQLHSRGHAVTVIRNSDSWYISETSPHYTSITVNMAGGGTEDFFRQFVSDVFRIKRSKGSAWALLSLQFELKNKFFELHKRVSEVVTHILENKELVKSLQDAKYDMVLTDPANGGGVMLAHYLGLPLVFNARWTAHGEAHFAIAPSPLSYVPLSPSELTDQMTFFDRVTNMVFYFTRMHLYKQIVGPHYSALSSRYFGSTDYFPLFQAADLWLMRVDFVFEFPRPTMPNVVYMGGFQCKPAKPLPQHLEEFVQSSGEHGVIVMSLGTLIAELPLDLADEIAATFAKLPQKVIWRYKGDRPASLGNNTLIVDWMPQNDLLGHPKIKLFVAHGGTNGLQEAIYHGVPVVGLPIFFDQYDNLLRLKERGGAKILTLNAVDKDDNFLKAIQEVLNEPSYRMNMQRLSRLHRDTPMKPMDTAIFWIEFVMRHKGAAHLRTESYRMPWYSYHSVDVVLFLLMIVLLVMLFFAGLVWSCYRMCFKRKVKSD